MMKPAFGRSSPPRDPATSPPRTSSPPPIPLPSGPSEEYLNASLEPSIRIQDPSTSRKLLILDLNGTLLFRSQNRRAPDGSQPYPHNSGGFGPRLRSVHPRPYAPSFVQYLFAPETRAWLDTMVWSSAQPHSVGDMVDKVFGEARAKLRAVWDRQSLGLGRDQYHRKTQTTKDLAKPWMLLSGHSNPHTTLLLDDSPLKARLQPYNHVCLPEYTGGLRAKDVRALELIEHERGREVGRQDDRAQEEGTEANVGAVESSSPESKKRKRAQRDVSGSHSPSSVPSSADVEPFDPTLLAVIGVLDALKHESNAAAWVRARGLFAALTTDGSLSPPLTAVDAASLVEVDEDEAEWTGISTTDGEPSAATEDNAVPSAPNAAAPQLNRRLLKKQRKREEKATARAAQVDTKAEGGNDGAEAGEGEKMWFADARNYACWVARGRGALKELGIEEMYGVRNAN
ncbi:hypothetical protein CONPUDRAFT_111312 [Coniophora puteana RWD-64-598 SS2]|uniref:Mitochondrial import inner membrane translocase subunit TIM50 n=1 Tax=Coniophora puteana (strain RWD-64-598) TaxID=741705 RepID=A0A5M3MCM8_CONPW|nr:uncharacterized protein CONPUDRAFT_111312 [Coniophora puteana RWD-64-598 SS2]EIW76395.1 hypothetical protein CONPUDRAFT_111312 [Coniophora puteana RWD-64-598 SS2]